MSKNHNILLVIVLLAAATLFHGSVAQTRHVVGDATGWTIPSGGAATYTTWAANKTFTIGDTLVFNYANGQHNVAKVTKSDFDACNGGSPLFTLTSSPSSVTLNETGEQYFICTVGSHCSLGQKLAVKVINKASTSSPAPQPSSSSGSPPKASPVPAPAPQPANTPPPKASPVPSSAPAPAPATGPVTYTVGDTLGWTVPSNGAAAYTSWASRKTFKVGDILVFNFQKNAHNVEEVTKTKYDSCNNTSPLATYSTPPVRVTLNKSGAHYFICGIPGHCSAGQKLAINVTGGSTTATPPSTAATPPSSATTPPSSSPTSPSPSSSSPTNPSSISPAGLGSPPPENSGAASIGAIDGLFAILMSVAAAAFFY